MHVKINSNNLSACRMLLLAICVVASVEGRISERECRLYDEGLARQLRDL